MSTRFSAALAATVATAGWLAFTYTSASILGAFGLPGPPAPLFFAIALLVHIPVLFASAIPGVTVALDLDAPPVLRRSPAKLLLAVSIVTIPAGGWWLLLGAVSYAAAWRGLDAQSEQLTSGSSDSVRPAPPDA